MWLQLLLTLLMALLNWLLNRENVPASKTTKLGKVRELCSRIDIKLQAFGVSKVTVTRTELEKEGIKEF